MDLLRSRPSRRTGEALYGAAVSQARQAEFYTRLGVPDRIDARFELYTLHVLLLVLRLRDEGPDGAPVAQDLFDAYVSALDDALRELGVGDISMARKMRKLGEALYGRMTAYEAPLRAGDGEALAAALARNVFESGPDATGPAALCAYALAARAGLVGQPVADLARGAVLWPDITA